MIEKIQKLLALANDKGATEAEAAQALKLPQQHMLKYNIEMPTSPASAAKFGEYRDIDNRWEMIVAMAAAKIYGCKTVKRAYEAVRFVGRSHNIEAAELTFKWLVDQVEVYYKRALLKGLSKSDRANFRRSFKEACAIRLYDRAGEITAANLSESKALVVINTQLEDEASELIANTAGIKKGRAMQIRAGSGAAAGRQAGDNIQLTKQVQ